MATSQTKHIAVIGGGAKAAALAAKAYARRHTRIGDVHVTIFEKHRIAAHWTGKFGYTDGKQLLCTPAERNVGFPYSSMGGEHVDAAMYSQFSWQSFLLSERQAYSRWVDYGSKPPTHEHFARYLEWVVRRAGVTPVTGQVTKLVPVKSGWVVHSATPGKRSRAHGVTFDGVVVSGPGPAERLAIRGKSDRTFDGVDFWLRLKEIPKRVSKLDKSQQIVIVGAGGTAAAALAWLARNGYQEHEIDGRAGQVAVDSRGDISIEVKRGSSDVLTLRASLLLDASGFDNWWFLKLIDGLPANKAGDKKYQERLRDSMSQFLSFQRPAWRLPPLHAPAHSALLGPGLGSLMTLGGMSDLVLSSYG